MGWGTEGWMVGERSVLRWKGGMSIKSSFCFLLLDSGQNLIVTALFWSLTLARQKGRGRIFMSHVFIKCFTKSVSLSKPASRVWDKNLCVGEGRRESWSIIWLFTTVRAKAASYWTLLGAMSIAPINCPPEWQEGGTYSRTPILRKYWDIHFKYKIQ